MGILPMSLTGVSPVGMPQNMGKMPMRLMGETPMLRPDGFFNGLAGSPSLVFAGVWKVNMKGIDDGRMTIVESAKPAVAG